MKKTVRRAETADIPAVLGLLSVVAQLHHRGRSDIFRDAMGKYSEDELRAYMDAPEHFVLVATGETGGVTGILFCRIKRTRDHRLLQDARVLWIDDTCVAEELRGQGYGKLMLDAAREIARDEGCNRLELNVWAFNQNAIDFYAREGLVPQRTVMEVSV